ncbi:MAG: SDR family oxidoreductase [Bryobacteraceae bacterium]
MRVLFIGGTGIISSACTQLAAQRGLDLTVLTRGRHPAALPPGVHTLGADIDDPASAAAALASRSFDAVVDWIAYTPAHIERDLALFRGRTRQFVFISSASAYQKPATDYLITESTPLSNPFWQYSRDKIACEDLLLRAWRDDGFPATIVRPSLTYGDTSIPLVLNSWTRPYTVVDRMRRGLDVIVPGDGSSLWTITHNSDFALGLVGLLGHAQAIGHAFHITSDEVLTWNQFFRIVAAAAGAEPRLVHIPSDFIAACLPDKLGTLLGDKSNSSVFDNSKIKRFVPTFRATVPFSEGIRRSLAWFDADPARQEIDTELNAAFDKLLDAWHSATSNALRRFQS